MDMNPHTARLVVHEGDQTRTVPIDPLPFTIGRQPDRKLFLSNPQVSREHAIILRDGEGFLIKDLSSRCGTLVNGERKDQARLKAGDRIQLGSIELLFVDAEDHVSPSAAMSRLSGDTGSS